MARARTPIHETLPVMLHKVELRVNSAMEAAAAAAGLSPRAILVLSQVAAVEPKSQRELSERMVLDQTLLVAAIDELETLEMIRRVRDPADRRQYRLEITERGIQLLDESERQLAAIERQVFDALSETERRQLASLLRKVLPANPMATQQNPSTS